MQVLHKSEDLHSSLQTLDCEGDEKPGFYEFWVEK